MINILLFHILCNQNLMLQILSGMVTPVEKSKELYDLATKSREEYRKVLDELIKEKTDE